MKTVLNIVSQIRRRLEGGAHSQFRDTFAVRLLEKGVSSETVSVLLGHSNIGITLKHYRP